MTPRTLLTFVSLALSVLIGLSLARSGRNAANTLNDAVRPLIGFSMDTLKEARWQVDRDLFVRRANELGAEVLVQAANSDDARQMADVQALISRRVKALVLVPHDGKAMADAVRLAHAAGIPVLAYDRIIRDCELDLYVSFDNQRVGRNQARYLVDRFRPTPQQPLSLVRIYGAPTDNNAHQFKAGQDEVLIPLIAAGSVRVAAEDWTEDWKPENAKRIMNAALTKAGSSIDAVLASNDGTAGGAIQALTEEGLAQRVVVTGQDAELVAIQRIARGTQAMTIYKPVRVLAGHAAELAVRMACGRPIVATATVPNGAIDVPAALFDVVTVTRDNIVDTVIADGFHRYEDVFGDLPADPKPAPPSSSTTP